MSLKAGMFQDRTDAGKRLGTALKQSESRRTLVLGIPRGGVEVAYRVAEALASKLSILIVRKLPFPEVPESGFGAVAEDGTVYLVPGAEHRVPRSRIGNIIRRQRTEVIRRIEALRKGCPLPGLQNYSVILVDDGIAMGSTVQAAVRCCHNLGAVHITVAAPVGSPDAVASLKETADDVFVLFSPPSFRAVADFYRDWYDVSDREVFEIMRTAARARMLAPESLRREYGFWNTN